ncbi:MAG: sulfotransferase domain-containing protein, partial [Cyanobacteria bacterium P01_D01_bin.73]
QIQSALMKEVHFFDLNFDKGWGWYLEQLGYKESLDNSESNLITGEASPYYIFHPLAPERVHRHSPKTKLIVLLRDPVARSLSHYHHECRWDFESLELEAALEKEGDRLEGEGDKFLQDPNYESYAYQHYSYVKRGFYLEQLIFWERYFSTENILVVQSEFLDQNNALVLKKVVNFLGLDEFNFTADQRHNSGRYPEASESIKQKLARQFLSPNQQLLAHLEKHYPADNLVGFGPGEVNWLTPAS